MSQVRKTGRRDEDESWEPMDNLKLKDPYVMKLVKGYVYILATRIIARLHYYP